MDPKDFEHRLAKDPVELARVLHKQVIVLTAVAEAMRKRVDPQLSEYAIMGNLSMPSSAETADALQIGAMLSLVAIYDRKLNRETFIEAAQGSTALYGMLGRLTIAEAILHMLEKESFTKDKIEEAVKELTTYAEAERHKIIKIMELVVQCPTSNDPIQ